MLTERQASARVQASALWQLYSHFQLCIREPNGSVTQSRCAAVSRSFGRKSDLYFLYLELTRVIVSVVCWCLLIAVCSEVTASVSEQ